MRSSPRGHGGSALAGALLRLQLAACALLAVIFGSTHVRAQAVGPTVREVVEFTRIVHPRNSDQMQLSRQVSPDGRRAYLVTRRADVERDSNRYQVLLLDLDPMRLAAGVPSMPKVLVSLDVSDDNDEANPALQDLRWMDDRTIVFRLRPRGLAFQVHKLDVPSGRMQQLTHAPLGVVSFALSQDLRRVVYATPHDNPPLAPGQVAVVVGNRSLWSVIHGQNDRRAQQRQYRFYVAEAGRPGTARALLEPVSEASFRAPMVDISPDGRWALLPRFEPARQLDWARQYPLIEAAVTRFGTGLTLDPLGYFIRPSAYVPRRLVAVRLSDGQEQVVLDAPDDSFPGLGQARSDRVWMDGGRSVVLGGTHLPVSGGARRDLEAGRTDAGHVVEYWPATGDWRVIAALDGRLDELRPVAGPGEALVAVDAGRVRRFERGADGQWSEPDSATQAAALPEPGDWSLRISEGLDVPPDVVAQGPGGRTVKLTRLNTQVDGTWGSMRPYRWNDAAGRVWDGGLMVPAGFRQGQPRAVVIQTYGFSPNRFYLDGSNVADGFTSGFAGRAFLREGILVVAMPTRSSNDWPRGDMAALAASTEGVLGLIRALVAEGLADRDRIGIMGWSSTGERVLHTLTFSDAPLRSASLLDGDANTLFSYTVTYGASDTILLRKERTNGGEPFGAGLERWLRNDPAMHTACITAAVRIETYGPWVKNNWDVHALLRRQFKPVEMLVLPGGSHGLLRPAERMLSLQGNVDWHRFWLLGEQRTVPGRPGETEDMLRAQYQRWTQMVELQRGRDTRPAGCVRFSESATRGALDQPAPASGLAMARPPAHD